MSDFRFEYRNDKGHNCLLRVTTTFEHDAWIMALKRCGWSNRTSLKLTNEKGYTITNWFEKSPILGFKESDRQYYIRTRELNNNRKHPLWGLSHLKSGLFCSC